MWLTDGVLAVVPGSEASWDLSLIKKKNTIICINIEILESTCFSNTDNHSVRLSFLAVYSSDSFFKDSHFFRSHHTLQISTIITPCVIFGVLSANR